MTRRLWASLALSLPVFGLEMGSMLLIGHHVPLWIVVVEALLTTLVLVAGTELWRRGYVSFRSRKLNMFSLITLGVATAYGYSMVRLGQHLLLGRSGHPPAVYFESASVITSRWCCWVRCWSCVPGTRPAKPCVRTFDADSTAGAGFPVGR